MLCVGAIELAEEPVTYAKRAKRDVILESQHEIAVYSPVVHWFEEE